jgi:hypothetical protein
MKEIVPRSASTHVRCRTEPASGVFGPLSIANYVMLGGLPTRRVGRSRTTSTKLFPALRPDAAGPSTFGNVEIEMLDDGRGRSVLDGSSRPRCRGVPARVSPSLLGPIVHLVEDGSVVHPD